VSPLFGAIIIERRFLSLSLLLSARSLPANGHKIIIILRAIGELGAYAYVHI
jgi:hypothetical protein